MGTISRRQRNRDAMELARADQGPPDPLTALRRGPGQLVGHRAPEGGEIVIGAFVRGWANAGDAHS